MPISDAVLCDKILPVAVSIHVHASKSHLEDIALEAVHAIGHRFQHIFEKVAHPRLCAQTRLCCSTDAPSHNISLFIAHKLLTPVFTKTTVSACALYTWEQRHVIACHAVEVCTCTLIQECQNTSKVRAVEEHT